MNEAANQLTAWQILAHYEQIAERNSASLSSAKANGEFIKGLQCKVGNYSMLAVQTSLVEVLSLPDITPVPGGPAWLLGLANRYGQLLPVIDGYGFITNKACKTPNRSLLVIGQGDSAVGIAISNIGLPVSAHISPAPPAKAQMPKSSTMPSSFTPFVHSWAVAGDLWHPIFDVEKLQHSINQWQN